MLSQWRMRALNLRHFSHHPRTSLLQPRSSRLFASNVDKKNLVAGLEAIQKKAIWLSTYMVHNANNIRPNRDGLKVGGHQASSSSCATILTALYLANLRKKDRIAVKPHASPLFHSLQYMLENQTQENLNKFRALGGVQSYPSRTKDAVDVDFSTGSVGLGAAITTFASYIQDWLRMKGYEPKFTEDGPGRMIALVGDAELDEGNVYEALIESWKLNMKESWWIIDYNRQSLDKITEDASFRQIDRMFRSNGWEVITIKYGKRLLRCFEGPGGKALRTWINTCDNSLYSSLVFRGGKEFRKQITKDIGDKHGVAEFLGSVSDQQLFDIMTNLGGHCFETLLEAFAYASSAESEGRRTCFICYTIKGFGLSTAGHRDNHGLSLNKKQVETMRKEMGIKEGEEWGSLVGLPDSEKRLAQQLIDSSHFKRQGKGARDYAATAAVFDIPDMFLTSTATAPISTQAAFGNILNAIASSKDEFADRVMTISPDVATSTNLTGFLNKRGVFGAEKKVDKAKAMGVMSMNKWDVGPTGQHVELGIAENNLFLMLAAAGLSAPLFGERVLPIGTLYDPFIARGLDALNYGCYQDSRFMVVATPAGITLAPEGGAHQSINTPLIGMGQPGLSYLEPVFADELQVAMSWGLRHMQLPAGEGGSIYLRLSTRALPQLDRAMTPELRSAIVRGGYFHHKAPSASTRVVIAFVGAVYPEASEAYERLSQRFGEDGVSLLQVTSPDILYQDCNECVVPGTSYVQSLLKDLPRDASFVTVVDGHPSTLAWLGAVRGNRVRCLGVTSFGQSGDITDLYKTYKIDTDSIVAAAEAITAAQ